MRDEEVAAKLVGLYFEDVARMGFKRQLDLDQVINAYFYTLKQLENKDVKMKSFERKIIQEEKEMLNIPEVKKTTIIEEQPMQKTTITEITQTTQTNNNQKKEKSVSEILEE